MAIIACMASGVADAQENHGKEFWKKVAANRYAVPAGEKAFPLAKELSGYLKSADPELRDDLAYSILARWVLRPGFLSNDELLSLEEEWRGNLKAGIGENGTDSIFSRSFSALSLSALAERELKSPFLGEERYRKLLDAALQYLKEEKDLRGFDRNKGWIHATAHTADLLAALVQHPSFVEQDQANVLKAIAQRLESARLIFTFGEQDRLTNTLAAMARRADFAPTGFAAWVEQMDRADQEIWNDSPPRLEGLHRFENDSYLLSAFVARLALTEKSPSAEAAQQAALKSLRRR